MTVKDNSDQKGNPQACLFVAHISFETTEESLQEHFAPYGEILSIKTLKDRSSRPYAFIQFSNIENADDALEKTNGSFLENRKLRVEKARVNRTLFIAKLSKKTTNTELREMAEEYGEVESVSIIKNHQTNISKGCGFVKFVHREDAQDAFNELKTRYKNLVVEWATSTNDPDLLGIDKCNIFVGGLNPQQIDEEILSERFGSYGEIESSTLVNRFANDEDDTKGVRSAFAFIRYKDESAASSAIENENGLTWLDRRIRVQYCESQEMKNKRRANKFYQSFPTNGNMYYPAMPNQPLMVIGGMPWTPYGTPYNATMYPSMDALPGQYSPYMMYPPVQWYMPEGEYPQEPEGGESVPGENYQYSNMAW